MTIDPIRPTVLDKLKAASKVVVSIGKIGQLFNGHGINRDIKTRDNA